MDKSENIIKKTAKVCLRRLPADSSLQLDDLIQEGWIVYLDCEHEFDKNRGTAFHTLLWTCLVNRYMEIVRTETRRCSRFEIDSEFIDSVVCQQTAEKQLIMHEFLMATARNFSSGFTRMIMNGPDKELFAVVRNRMRQKRTARGLSSTGGRIRFSTRLLGVYFGLDLSKSSGLARSAYKML